MKKTHTEFGDFAPRIESKKDYSNIIIGFALGILWLFCIGVYVFMVVIS